MALGLDQAGKALGFGATAQGHELLLCSTSPGSCDGAKLPFPPSLENSSSWGDGTTHLWELVGYLGLVTSIRHLLQGHHHQVLKEELASRIEERAPLPCLPLRHPRGVLCSRSLLFAWTRIGKRNGFYESLRENQRGIRCPQPSFAPSQRGTPRAEILCIQQLWEGVGMLSQQVTLSPEGKQPQQANSTDLV